MLHPLTTSGTKNGSPSGTLHSHTSLVRNPAVAKTVESGLNARMWIGAACPSRGRTHRPLSARHKKRVLRSASEALPSLLAFGTTLPANQRPSGLAAKARRSGAFSSSNSGSPVVVFQTRSVVPSPRLASREPSWVTARHVRVGWADGGGPPRPAGGSPPSAHPTAGAFQKWMTRPAPPDARYLESALKARQRTSRIESRCTATLWYAFMSQKWTAGVESAQASR